MNTLQHSKDNKLSLTVYENGDLKMELPLDASQHQKMMGLRVRAVIDPSWVLRLAIGIELIFLIVLSFFGKTDMDENF
jgi:hypothetical protein